MTDSNHSDLTRERLLDQAEVLFSQKDFAAVSVRELTAAADCNLGAVNYHFGSKQNLYLEVFRSRWIPRALKARAPVEKLIQRDGVTLEEILGSLAQGFMYAFASPRERKLHFGLMVREMSSPGEAYGLVLEQTIKPTFKLIRSLIRPHLPPDASEESVLFSVLSIMGQVLYFNMARDLIQRLTHREYDQDFVKTLAGHIANFSLRGLTGRVNGEETQ